MDLVIIPFFANAKTIDAVVRSFQTMGGAFTQKQEL